jgi:hypothetical protein
LLKVVLLLTAHLLVWGALAGCAIVSSPTPTPLQPTAIPQPPASAGAAAQALLSGKTLTFRVVPEQSEASYEVREHIFRFPSPQTTLEFPRRSKVNSNCR